MRTLVGFSVEEYKTGLIDGFSDGSVMEEDPNVSPYSKVHWGETTNNSIASSDFPAYRYGYEKGLKLADTYYTLQGNRP